MSPDEERTFRDMEARRFVMFGGADRAEVGGLGDALTDAPTLLECVEAAHRLWGEMFPVGDVEVRLNWAHVWDMFTDEVTKIPAGKQGREVLLEGIKGTGPG